MPTRCPRGALESAHEFLQSFLRKTTKNSRIASNCKGNTAILFKNTRTSCGTLRVVIGIGYEYAVYVGVGGRQGVILEEAKEVIFVLFFEFFVSCS